MDTKIRDVMVEATSLGEERVTFGEVVMKLMQRASSAITPIFCAARTPTTCPTVNPKSWRATCLYRPRARFSAAGVDAAVRDIQAGKIQYRAFCARIAEAGCEGYHVSLAGRRAVYYGRTGDCHVEWFPGAQPEKAA